MSEVTGTPPPPVLSLTGIIKSFAGTEVLHGVGLELAAGEVHALVGENGAGKSTLMKIAAGVYRPDSGQMALAGEPFAPRSPRDALLRGVAMVHQELSLAPDVSVAENILAGMEPCRAGMVDWKRLYVRACELLQELGVDLPLRVPVRSLGIGQRQIVEVLKALAARPRCLVFDEPTSSLEAAETAVVLAAIRRLTAKGIGVVYISHRMAEVFDVADRITVLRDGSRVWTRIRQEVTPADTVSAMVGRELAETDRGAASSPGDELLRVEALTRRGAFSDVSFALRRGEIIGFAGLVGAGRTELMRSIFGVDRLDAGRLWVRGQPRRIRSARQAVGAGLAYVPEDRKTLGLFLDRSVQDNIVCASLPRCSRNGMLSPRLERSIARRGCERLDVRAQTLDQDVGSLSGGNQQKTLLARWMATEPAVLIVDEPTRGVDVGAKAEIHRMLRAHADAGSGVIVVSSDMPEILGLCDRILVMHEGRVTGELPREQATEDRLIHLAVR